jgi:hypothetical protein
MNRLFAFVIGSVIFCFAGLYSLYEILKREYMAAKAKTNSVSNHIAKPKVKRPGVHAKSKHSTSKTSKNYTKAYRAQGK